MNFAICVQKIINPEEEIFNDFPIEFDILIHSKTEHNKIQLLSPNKVHTKKIDSQAHLSFQIHLNNWKSQGMILFSTHFIDVKAVI